VDTLVKRVRKKIEADPAAPEVILTVWGAGYKAADV
jgi:DNA-binding response OmpR family regulator